MKKIVSFVVVTLLAVAMAVSAVACTKKKAAVTLVDFPATFTEETQEAGDFYTLRREVRDTNDNTYPLTAEVKTSAGGGVSVIGGEFELTDIGGYVVTYTAHISDSDTRTSVVTIPVADNVAPTVSIPTPPSGFVGELYTLPTINFADNIGVTAKSVKVYRLDGKDDDNEKDENEQTLTPLGDTYTFTPTERGYYRIVASATDGAGHTTTRTADFAVDEIYPKNIIFAPEALGAGKQLHTSKDAHVQTTFVPADEERQEDYKGAYYKMVLDEDDWCNTFLTPIHEDINKYKEYDVITAWIYADSKAPSATMQVSMLNDKDAVQYIYSNQWTVLEIDPTKFVEKIGTTWFYAIKYDCSQYVYGTRLGEVAARKRVSFTISEIEDVAIPEGGEATVTFTVTPPEGVDEYTVRVTDGSDNEVTPSPAGTNSYSCRISAAGDYTVTVATPNDSVYYGSATETFVAKDNSYREEIIFDPTASGARAQLHTSKDAHVETTFVPAEENDDETYGGAYYKMVVDENGWCNTFLTPAHEISSYADYDVITAWIYADSNAASAQMQVSMLNDVAAVQHIYSNQWAVLEIDPAKFVEKIGTTWFYAISYSSQYVYGTRLGEVAARKRTANYFTISEIGEVTILDDGAKTVTFTVTPPEDVEYTVKVTDGSGSVIPTSLTETDSYSCQISTAGEYTVTVTPNDGVYYGSASKTFVAKDNSRIELDGGQYPAMIDVGEELDILDVKVYKADAEQPGVETTVKVYKKSGDDWVDDSENLQGKKYTPQEKGEIKVEYSAELVANKLSYEIQVVEPYVFNPTAESGDKIKVNKNTSFNLDSKTFVAADGERQEEYKGAYWRLPTNGTADWNNIGFDFEHETDYYKKYDFITMWLKIESTGNAVHQVSFGGSTFWNRRNLKDNEWIRVVLTKPIDNMTGTPAESVFYSNFTSGNGTSSGETQNFNLSQFIPIKMETTATALLIGEITGGMKANSTERETVFFNPDEVSTVSTAFEKNSNGQIDENAVNPDASGGYSGRCVSWTPTTGDWSNLYLRPTAADVQNGITAGGAEVRIWIYVSGEGEDEFLMFGKQETRLKIKCGEWVQVTLSLGQYNCYLTENKGNNADNTHYFMSQNDLPADTTVYIGEGTIVTYEDRAD